MDAQQVEAQINLHLNELKTVFHAQELDDQMGYDCLLKSLNSLMGFPFFTHRDQAVRFIQSKNYGFNNMMAAR